MLYQLTDHDIELAFKDESVQLGAALCLQIGFDHLAQFYRGTEQVSKRFTECKTWQDTYKLLTEIPLAYFASCEDPKEYEQYFDTKRDEIYREAQDEYECYTSLLKSCNSALTPQWWCYTGHCETLAVFLLFPMAKILFPKQRFKLFAGNGHVALLNHDLKDYENYKSSTKSAKDEEKDSPMVIDLITQCVQNGDLEWLLEYPCRHLQRYEKEVYEGSELRTWFELNYFDCEDYAKKEDIEKFFAFVK